MTREEIEKFSDEEPYCFGYCVGCIDGLKAADAEPNLESLWHDASEEPKDNFAQILYQDKFGTCRVTVKHDIVVMLGAEVGELQGKIAKAVRSGVADINENRLVFREQVGMEYIHPFMESLAYEIGDILWQTAGIAKALGFSLDEIAMMNLNKLASRKERGVIDGNGDNR